VQTYYRWRTEYDRLKLEQAKRTKELEKENTGLKRLGDRAISGEAGVDDGTLTRPGTPNLLPLPLPPCGIKGLGPHVSVID